DGLHCGEGIDVLVDDKWVHSRMEMSWTEDGSHWYLVGTPYYGDLEYVRVRM
ncbi:MAG TPA: DUF5348 domain-containing protein, partial [Lachnospiraceae bacterium]|nr:DUF5348 domain-containing protein [Lachnospiraceae bacterium]